MEKLVSFTLRGKTFKIYSNPDSEQVCQQDICRGETWEPWFTEYLLNNLESDSVFVDVGASVGWFALLAAAHTPQGRIIAFEPHAGRYKMLVNSITENGFTNVTPVQAALSDKDGFTTIGGKKEDQMGRSGQEIRTKLLDEVLEVLEIDQVDLLKMDIEGAEVRALYGMERTLRAPNIKAAIEVHPVLMARYGDTAETLYAIMEKHGFERRSGSSLHTESFKIFEKIGVKTQ